LSTVRSLSAYERVCSGRFHSILVCYRYEDKLRIAGKTGKKKGLTVSFSLALIYFFIFLCYSVGFW